LRATTATSAAGNDFVAIPGADRANNAAHAADSTNTHYVIGGVPHGKVLGWLERNPVNQRKDERVGRAK
jgi:hypothetical protein